MKLEPALWFSPQVLLPVLVQQQAPACKSRCSYNRKHAPALARCIRMRDTLVFVYMHDPTCMHEHIAQSEMQTVPVLLRGASDWRADAIPKRSEVHVYLLLP